MIKDITIQLLGKEYQIKCPDAEVNALQRAAQYLEEKMRLTRESGIISLDRIAIIAALNVSHQLLMLEQQKNQHAHSVSHRLTELNNKIENALAQHKQMELLPAE